MHKTHHYDAQQTKKIQGGDTWLSCRKINVRLLVWKQKRASSFVRLIVYANYNYIGYTSKMNFGGSLPPFHKCGATLISSCWAITVAKCFVDPDEIENDIAGEDIQ